MVTFHIPSRLGESACEQMRGVILSFSPSLEQGGDEGEGGAASEVFRVYNQPFRQLSVTLSQPSPLKGEGNKFNFFPFTREFRGHHTSF